MTKKKITVDRFEGEYAVCETKTRRMINIQKSRLPVSTKEGDVLIKENGEYVIDVNDTEDKSEVIKSLMDELFE